MDGNISLISHPLFVSELCVTFVNITQLNICVMSMFFHSYTSEKSS